MSHEPYANPFGDTSMPQQVANKDSTIKQLLRCIRMGSNECPPNIEGKKPWCRTKRGPDGAGSSTDLCGRDMGECWDEWESIVTARKKEDGNNE